MTRRNPPSSRQDRQAGLALLEVLVSILLFSLGVLGLVGLQARAISLSVDAEDRNRAALIANEIATAMWITKSVTVAAGSGSTWEKKVRDGFPNGALAVRPVSGTTNSADILIRWKAPQRAGADADSQLSTRITLPAP